MSAGEQRRVKTIVLRTQELDTWTPVFAFHLTPFLLTWASNAANHFLSLEVHHPGKPGFAFDRP